MKKRRVETANELLVHGLRLLLDGYIASILTTLVILLELLE
jgi:hypothetical protein